MRRKRFFWIPDLKLGGMLYDLWYPLLRDYWYDRLKNRCCLRRLVPDRRPQNLVVARRKHLLV